MATKKDNSAALLYPAITQAIENIDSKPAVQRAKRDKDKKALAVSYNQLIEYGVNMFLVGKAWTN